MEIQDQDPTTLSDKRALLSIGVRFAPTDEELVVTYLNSKDLDSDFVSEWIGEVDLNTCEPWDLPAKRVGYESPFYFFSPRDRINPAGERAKRATNAGYWNSTGKDREVNFTNKLVGMKKTLVFYTGRAPKGVKTNWIMHEYRLEGVCKLVERQWVLCRVFQKTTSNSLKPNPSFESEGMPQDSLEDASISGHG